MAGPPTRTERTTVTCTGCGAEASVPFTPTPGRPVYCRTCFAKQGSGPRRSEERPPPRSGSVRKRMLAQGRKSHFVYDVTEILGRGDMLAENRRPFIEMLFIRGARQGTDEAHKFLETKVADKTISEEEAERISHLVERYSFWR